MPKTASPSLFYVSLKGHRLTGLVEGEDTIRHAKRPIAPHYRARDWSGNFPRDAAWLYGEEVANELAKQGLEEIPTAKGENWVKRNLPVRSGLRAQLFDGCVFEAVSAGDAKSQFEERFGIKSTQSDFFKVVGVGVRTRVGLANTDEIKPLGKK